MSNNQVYGVKKVQKLGLDSDFPNDPNDLNDLNDPNDPNDPNDLNDQTGLPQRNFTGGDPLKQTNPSATARTSTTTAAVGPGIQVGLDGEARTHGCIYKIHVDGLDLLKKISVDHVGQIIHFKNLVIIFRLIQSHAQRGP